MGYIPEDFISSLLDNIDIVDVIGSYVPLKKMGHNYMACCPFHHEKTPSFSIVQNKQFYHCFGCGVGGSSIKFVMEYEKLAFVEAVTKLAGIAGLEIPVSSSISNEKMSIDKALYRINQLVSNFYYNNLLNNNLAKQYLVQRGIIKEICDKFQLGYSSADWGNLDQVLKDNHDVSYTLLKQAGLWLENSNPNNNAKGYARFRNRIMFPIHNIQGKIIGFGGRLFVESNNNNQPKYLNSPETFIFKKSNDLYGLYQALQTSSANRSKDSYFLMVEGYMDVISLAQHGISNAVATLGTASSHQHFVKLFKYTEKIIICFDGDLAGKRAAYRAMIQALPIISAEKSLSFCFLPGNHDPDSYIREYGKIGFEKFLKNSESLSTFIFNNLTKELDINSLEGKSKFVSLFRSIVNKVYDEIVKEFLLSDLANKLDLALDRLKHMLEIKSEHKLNQASYKIERYSHVNKPAVKGNNKLINNALSILLQYPYMVKLVEQYQVDLSKDSTEANIFYQVVTLIKQGFITSAQILDNWNDDKSKAFITEMMLVEHLVDKEHLELEFADIMKNLKKTNKDEALDSLLCKVKNTGIKALSLEEKHMLTELLKEK
tara:strand:- start:2040 stop:3842 length:1803 start_codon:yes stop_codon:yes gene_type:complete